MILDLNTDRSLQVKIATLLRSFLLKIADLSSGLRGPIRVVHELQSPVTQGSQASKYNQETQCKNSCNVEFSLRRWEIHVVARQSIAKAVISLKGIGNMLVF